MAFKFRLKELHTPIINLMERERERERERELAIASWLLPQICYTIVETMETALIAEMKCLHWPAGHTSLDQTQGLQVCHLKRGRSSV